MRGEIHMRYNGWGVMMHMRCNEWGEMGVQERQSSDTKRTTSVVPVASDPSINGKEAKTHQGVAELRILLVQHRLVPLYQRPGGEWRGRMLGML